MPGEKARKECKRERNLSQLSRIQKRLTLKPEVTSFPAIPFSNVSWKQMLESEIKLELY